MDAAPMDVDNNEIEISILCDKLKKNFQIKKVTTQNRAKCLS